ncbi:glucosamine-6-phosphate deaminase [Streptococcus loxodontisalivarius]|uniref:Glucosamine-6-phosphate deaminase n=1 Tax=Streptococcus loxodontisalivarius TaxID=1349415 RepID=A0ABS2PUM0_9STRE|nr:glucosamine-6-phosphate deaminase [Streptococcus loxodontisalivarius]MBM7643027.1 glucosamine-6-phosphate deaminase [Streptococcus loxodontisalivarius]
MKIIRVSSQKEGGQRAFDLLVRAIDGGAKVLGLATGSTPLSLYEEMAASDYDFSDLTTINLDEYVGLAASSPQSYHTFMQERLFQYKSFKASYLPDGQADDLEKAVRDYDQILAAQPIDLQILGIGHNGHIGFNEPGTAFDSKTHLVNLKESTIKANARFFEDEHQVPRQAISMGIASIMAAKKIILLAFGEEKADAIKAMVEGPVTEDLPASILQRHPDLTLILDHDAASKLM